MDWKDEANRQMDKAKNKAEIGVEKLKKAANSAKHDISGKMKDDVGEAKEKAEKMAENAKYDAKIEMKEQKENIQQGIHDLKKDRSEEY